MTSAKKIRRGALAGAATLALAATGLFGGVSASAEPNDKANSASQCAGRSVPASKISIQLFSYNSWIRAVGIETVLAELARIGYKNVEPFSLNNMTAEQYSALLKEYGLKAPTRHASTAESTFDLTLADAKTLGQKYTGSGGFASPGIGTYENVLATAATMNRLGERSVQNGTGKLFGHNHQQEFTTTYVDPVTGETKSAWQILAENTDPRYVAFQLDVLWAADAGVDVVELIEQYGDRIELLHIKDGALNGTSRAIPSDVGEGEIDWAPILDAAQGKVKYYSVERDGAPSNAEFAEDSFNFLTCFAY